MSDPATTDSVQSRSVLPDYSKLVRFLVEPFLESPESLSIDCEVSPRTNRVLVRLAFEGEDKGRVFGRGGRNIQAIRSIVQALAQTAGFTAHLDVYGGYSVNNTHRDGEADGKASAHKPSPRRPPKPRS